MEQGTLTNRNHQGSVGPPSRRGFLGWAGATAALWAGWILGIFGSRRLSATAGEEAAALPEVPGNHLVRMQKELLQALTRPISRRRWVMVVDVRACSGCQACVVACRAENNVGPEGSYRRVPEGPAGRFPNLTNVFMPTHCVQCDDPPCMRAVPAGMITKRPDGIVEFDYRRLRGSYAEAARAACPYRAVHVDQGRLFTHGTPAVQAYETRPFEEYQGQWQRVGANTLSGAARKCHFCLHRIEAGILPACVTTCMGHAVYFGDANDPTTLVSEMLANYRWIRIHEEAGIEPRVYYVEEPIAGVRARNCATCH
ncbi:MAG: 4Fe-4S dicluster domain-containing protein [Thermoanaerobaculum sp.]|nr:4Fe-4S dicluster domain-containing protein [Thermoanaerobaculum sp.]